MRIACIVLATAKRRELLEKQVIPSLVTQPFNEIVVIGDYKSGLGYRHLPFPDLTASTLDALFKKDVATMATTSDWLVYLCDDHKLAPDFVEKLRKSGISRNNIGVPERTTVRGDVRIKLNMGMPDYCGGHAGVFHRTAIQTVPWSVSPWHPNWDVFHSRMLVQRGYTLVELPGCGIEDIEGGTPWV